MEKQMTPTEKLIAEVLELDQKATKGPWENEDDRMVGAELPWRSTGLIWQKDDQSYQKCICRIDAAKLAAHSPKEQIDEFEGNAELIAYYRTAAPLLAKMLQKAMKQRNVYINLVGKWDGETSEDLIYSNNAKLDAIATGEK